MTGTVIELYDTNGAVGAAKGAGIGAGIYKNAEEAFASLKKINVIEPDGSRRMLIAGRSRRGKNAWNNLFNG